MQRYSQDVRENATCTRHIQIEDSVSGGDLGGAMRTNLLWFENCARIIAAMERLVSSFDLKFALTKILSHRRHIAYSSWVSSSGEASAPLGSRRGSGLMVMGCDNVWPSTVRRTA